MGPTRWLGGILEIVGFFGSLGAIGMIWHALRWKQATHSLQHYVQDGAVLKARGSGQSPDLAGGSFRRVRSDPQDT
jgi:hypothetical protein